MNLSTIIRKMEEEKLKEKKCLEMEIDQFKLSLKYTDENQRKVLNTDLDKYLVEGPAGSGKTILAMIKILEMEKNNLNYNVILYTKMLKRFLQGKMERFNFENVNDKIYYADEWKKIEIDDEQKFDYVIVDEVQDLSTSEIDDLITKCENGYYLYGDTCQQIYPIRTENKDIINEIKCRYEINTFKLNQTYRLPLNIAKFASCIDKRNSKIEEKCYIEGTTDNIPSILEFQSMEDEMQYIKDVIQAEGWKNVGILLKRNDKVKKVYEMLADLEFPCECKYNIPLYRSEEEKEEKEDNINFATNRPKILTYHSSKGLEFERVFLPQCDVNESVKSDGTCKYNFREALFVAVTRASQTLIISYEKNRKSIYLDEIDESLYKFKEN